MAKQSRSMPETMTKALSRITSSGSRIEVSMEQRGPEETARKLYDMALARGISFPTEYDLRRIRIGKTRAERSKARAA